MCKEVFVNDVLCSTHGELKEELGGAAMFDPRVADITDDDCLCGLDVPGTAAKYGLIIEENGWQPILRSNSM